MPFNWESIDKLMNLKKLKKRSKDPNTKKRIEKCSKKGLGSFFRIYYDGIQVVIPGLRKLNFYKNWLLIIQNDKCRKNPQYFGDVNISPDERFIGEDTKEDFEDIRNHDLIKRIDWALIGAFGYTSYCMLLSGQVFYLEKEKNIAYITPLQFSNQKQSQFISQFDIRPLHHNTTTKIEDDFLDGTITFGGKKYSNSAAIRTSFLLFGFYHQFRTIDPPKRLEIKLTPATSTFLSDYYINFRGENHEDYLQALQVYLEHDYHPI